MGWVKGQSGNPGGNNGGGGVRASRQNLAAWLRENVSEEQIGTWLIALTQGRDPRAKPGELAARPTLEQSLRAMTMLLERRDGMAPQHIHLEAEMRSHLTVLGTQIDPARLADLAQKDPAKLKALRDGLRALVSPTAKAPEPIEPIEAEATEVADVPNSSPAVIRRRPAT